MKKRIISLLLTVLLLTSLFSGCNLSQTATELTSPTPASEEVESKNLSSASENSLSQVSNEKTETKPPKYIFIFIGDGMSHVQINAAQVFGGNNTSGQIATQNLNFTQFPYVGVATTHDSTSFCPDSASTATAFSAGIKTHSGVLGMQADKTTPVTNIAEQLKANGKKIGVVSSVTINHATPAAYYAHSESRNNYYDIALQLSQSDFDYFGGGSLSQPTGKEEDQPDAYGIIESAGYKVVRTKEDIMALNSSDGKVYAVSPVLQDSGSMPYSMDVKDGDLKLADFVSKGIDVLDNENGFFMMIESGKVDWACHANDAMAAIGDVKSLESAVQVALDFAAVHPEDTLIIVTGDHETGGLTIGYATTGYNTSFDIIKNQKMSYVAFDELLGEMKEENSSLTFEDMLPVIKENFGLLSPNEAETEADAGNPMILTNSELERLQNAFAETMKSEESREDTPESSLLYGGYEPFTITLTHILNNKAGIGWTSYSHTGTPVPVFATGVGAEKFGGSYDNTDVYKKLVEICGL